MAIYTKDVLYPGAYRLPDGRRVNYSRQEVERLAKRANEMLAHGLHIPVCWEHQDGIRVSRAERLADRARLNLGHVVAARAHPEGFLEIDIDVPNDEDAKRLPSARFVSPQFEFDITDSDDRKWDGRSLTHVAVTPRPVQHRQQPFRPKAQEALGVVSRAVERLSLDGYLGEKEKMAEENDTSADDGGAEGGSLGDLIEALKGAGLSIPDEVQDIAGLIIAVKASSGNTADTTDSTDTIPDATGDTEGVSEASGGPVMMSADAQKRIDALEARLVQSERKSLERRVRDLLRLGKVPKAIHDRLLADLKTERLSLDQAGNLQAGKLLAQVEAYEALEPSPFLRERLSTDTAGLREVEPPTRSRPTNEKETDAVLSAWDAGLGRK